MTCGSLKKTLVLAVSLCLCLSPVAADGDAASPTGVGNDPAAIDKMFRDIISIEGKVDYARLKAEHIPTLDVYIAGFKDVGAPGQPMADYINLYNVAMLKAVLKHTATNPHWKPSDDGYSVFKEKFIPLKPGLESLDYVENDMLRKGYKDPRVHVAINCAAVSCPKLIRGAYHQETLSDQLDANFTAFLADRTRNVFDDATKTARLSSILHWFADDFGGPEGVKKYLQKYRPVEGGYGDWKITFLDYDWTVNMK